MLSEEAKGIAAAVARGVAGKIEELSEELRKGARNDAEHRLVPIDAQRMELPVSFTANVGRGPGPLGMMLPGSPPEADEQRIVHTIVLLRCAHCGSVGNQVLVGTWDIEQLRGSSVRDAVNSLTATRPA